MGQDISFGELTRRAESPLQFVVESKVNVDLFVFRAVKRTGGRVRTTAPRLNRIPEKYQFGVMIGLAGLLRENVSPGFLCVIEHKRNKLYQWLLGLIHRGVRAAHAAARS